MSILSKIITVLSILSWTIYFILIQTGKNILGKLGYKVTIMYISISDYKNLKRHSLDNSKIRKLYKSLIISTIVVIICTIAFLIEAFLSK